MKKVRSGIVIEIPSKKQCFSGKLGKISGKYWLVDADGHITHCIVLPEGCVHDKAIGLQFQIDVKKGDEKENVFFLPWERILEVRTLDGTPIYRNCYLCPKCRRITKFFLRGRPFCRHCEQPIPVKANRKICISLVEAE